MPAHDANSPGSTSIQFHEDLFASIALHSGTRKYPAECATTETLYNGFRIVALRGDLRCWINDGAEVHLTGPSACVILDDGTSHGGQRFTAHVPQQYAVVSLPAAVMQSEFADEFDCLLQRNPGTSATFSHRRLGAAAQAVLLSILRCTHGGSIQRLYLAGKALELTALVLQGALGEVRIPRRPRLLPRDRERVREACRYLQDHLATPPSLAQLARITGTNRRKLNEDFRTVCGKTVATWLQGERLHTAHRLLCNRERNVTEAAAEVGYSAAHFSTLFHQHFGITPRQLL